MENLVLVAVALISGFIGFLIGKFTGSKENSHELPRVRDEKPNPAKLSKPEPRQDLNSAELKSDIENYLSDGSKIAAIKEVRERTGVGLAEAKHFVDDLENGVESAEAATELAPNGRSDKEGAIERVKELLRKGRKIEALKAYREMSGLGLREAKEELDRIERAIRLGLER